MEENLNQTPPEQAPAEAKRPARVAVVVMAVLTTIAAWVCTAFNARLAVVVSLLAVILSIIGMRSGRRGLRILSTTTLIASATLLLVVAAFIVAVMLTI